MLQAKLGPERAQAKKQKTLCFLMFFAIFAHFLARAALVTARTSYKKHAKTIGFIAFLTISMGQFGTPRRRAEKYKKCTTGKNI